MSQYECGHLEQFYVANGTSFETLASIDSMRETALSTKARMQTYIWLSIQQNSGCKHDVQTPIMHGFIP